MALADSRWDVHTRNAKHRRGRGRGWLVFVVVLLVAFGLLVVADRVAAEAAARQLAGRVATSVSEYGVTGENTSASVAGFPFLTQVARGQYEGLHLTLHDVGKDGIVVDTLMVEAKGIALPLSALLSGEVAGTTADSVSGTAVFSWQNLADSADLPDATFQREGNAVRVRAPLNTFGINAEGTGLASVVLTDAGLIRIEVQDVQVEGTDVPQQVVDLAATKLSQEHQIPKLPYGLQLTGVEVVDAGIQVTADAQNVLLVG